MSFASRLFVRRSFLLDRPAFYDSHFLMLGLLGLFIASSAYAQQRVDDFDTNKRAYVQQADGSLTAVDYKEVSGYAVIQGDVVIGKIQDMRSSAPTINGIVITGAGKRWPNKLIPWQFHSDLDNLSRWRFLAAIHHWSTYTDIRFVKRTPANQANYPDYVEVVKTTDNVCRSFEGRQGGRQKMWLSPDCGNGIVIHEIGHAVGLRHEHIRQDRDNYIKILWENIIPGAEVEFKKQNGTSDDIGIYDYDSIMHYGPTEFGIPGNGGFKTTIVPTNPPSAKIGQLDGLSKGDIATVKTMYAKPDACARVGYGLYSWPRYIASGMPGNLQFTARANDKGVYANVRYKIVDALGRSYWQPSSGELQFFSDQYQSAGFAPDIRGTYFVTATFSLLDGSCRRSLSTQFIVH